MIYLVRHGQTAWNREEIFRGTSDVPLDDHGRRQAGATGSYLRDLKLQEPLLYTSPLSRAAETAKICAEALSAGAPVIEPAFNDLDFGLWEGHSKDEVASRYPDLFQQWVKNPQDVAFPRGETLGAVATRAEPALLRLAGEAGERDLIIVSHRVVLKVLLCLAIGAGLGAFWKIRQDTACINVLEFKHASLVIAGVNQTGHLAGLKP